MSAPTPKSDYLLLFRGTDWDKGLSPEEIQKVVNRLMAWLNGLQREGKVKAGHPLGAEGCTISGNKGRHVVDGPFLESKEAIGGYVILHVADMEEAVALSKTWPCLDYGGIVEVRPVAEECPTFQRVKEQLAAATA